MKKQRATSPNKPINSFSRQDFIVLFLLFVLGIFMMAIIYFPSAADSSDKSLEISQDGKVIMILPIDKDTSQQIKSPDGQYLNTFEIKDRQVKMTQANCHDSTCIRTGTISRVGETIVCLPHRLVLKIISSENQRSEDDIDAIVQ